VYDCVLSGGTLIDGTGAPGRRADVAIEDGRIVDIGRVDGPAARRIDVDGLVVAPGFVDMHTHYDAQVNWDGELTPSSWHGVTTVIGGNCGFTVAPIDPDSADYVLRMLAVVEGIPFSALETLRCDWDGFGSWLATLDGQLAVNAGFLVGHTTLRRLVMGEASVGGQSDSSGPVAGAEASPGQLAEMERVLHESLAAGALGLSSSRSGHTDHFGLPVPSRFASDEELLRLSAVLAGHPGTLIEFSPDELFAADFTERMCELMATMSTEAKAPLIWNALNVSMGEADAKLASKLHASDVASRQAGRVVALSLPHGNPLRLNFETGISYDSIPGWAAVMHARLDPGLGRGDACAARREGEAAR
jgi:N-acyl-D-aspartate/D-glutamate deacylase